MPLPVPAFSIWADGTLTWAEFLEQVALPPLPDGFPLPPDGAVHVEGSFDEAGEFIFCCAIDFESATEPEIAGVRLGRRCRFEFRAAGSALSGGGPIAGEVFLETEARLPELPDLPGMVEFSSGDSSGRVRLRFHARADAGGELQLSAEVMDPLALRLQIPGMPQPEAPVQAELDRAAIEFAAGPGGATMKLELLGSFELHPFVPPVQLPVSQYLTPLFATLPELGGSCRLSLGMEGGAPTLGFAATLDNAEVEIDIVGMLSNLAAGLSNPQGTASEAPLEIDFGFRLIGLSFALGGPAPASGGPLPFAVTLTAQMRLGGVEAVGGIFITGQEFSLGLDRMTIPLTIPRFPITREEFERWYNDPDWESAISGRISVLEADTSRTAQRVRSRLQVQKVLMQAVCTLRGDYHGASGYHMTGTSRQLYGQWLSCIFDALDKATSVVAGADDEARYMVGTVTLERLREELMPEAVPDAVVEALNALKDTAYDSEDAFLSALADHLSPDMLSTLKAVILKCAVIRGAALRAMIGGEEHRICEDLGIMLKDVKFRVPFQSPRDIGVSGGARLSGFVGPYAFLNDVELVLGLSADLIYFSIKTIDGNIPIPDVGRYTGGSINFSEFRFGFGYTKRSVAIAFAGGVVLPTQLVDDLDTSDITVAGIRLPVQTRLSFRFELIPVPGIKVMPLFQFNLDLRQNYSPGLTDSSRCVPYWDGLQVIVPGVVHVSLKHIALSPVFAILPAMNWSFDGDIVLGNKHNGFSLIIDDLLGIDYVFTGTSIKIPIPGLAGDAPFCENFCMSLRVAGFAVNFNVQRPFPSASPLALFELLALLSDPEHYKVNPRGELANSLRVTLKDAWVALPAEVRRHFPGSEALVRQPLDITINLADFISAAQQIFAIAKPIVTAVVDAVKQGADDAQNIPARLEQCKNELADLNWRKALTWLPAEVRTFSLHASFAGFNADATIVLMTRDEALDELRRHGRTPSKRPAFKSLGPGKPFNLNAFRTLMFQLPAPPGMPTPYDKSSPANNAFAAPAFAGLTTRLLKELLPTADEVTVIAAARVEVFGASQQCVGTLSADGAFRLVTTSEIEPFVLQVAGLTVVMPLQFRGRMELAGDGRRASAAVLVSAQWPVMPGILELTLGQPRKPLLLRIGSDSCFALNGPAEAKLFGGICEITGVIDVTESQCLIDDATFRYSLAELVKVEANVSGRIGPRASFAVDGDGKIKIFGKSFDIAALKLNERRLELETRLLLSKWRLPDGETIPCTVDMKLRGGVDFRAGMPNFALAGEGDVELFGARLSGGRGGIRYQNGQLSLFAEGVLHWHNQEWVNASVELGPDGVLIQGRVSMPFEIKPPGFTVGMVAALNISARLKIDLASGNLLDMEARGDWLLGVSLTNTAEDKPHILPIACNKLPTLTAPQLPYRLIKVDGFPVPKIKGLDFAIPLPTIEPDWSNTWEIQVPRVSIDLPKLEKSTGTAITSILNWISHLTQTGSFMTGVHYDGYESDDEPAIDLRDEPLYIPKNFVLKWEEGAPQFPLPFDQIPGFTLWLAWNPEKKRFKISSESSFPPPQIDVLYDPVGIDITGEYVELYNTADIPIDLTGWLLHDAAYYTHTYTFPPFILPPGEKVKIWTKEGSNDAGNLYWGLKHAVWNNVGDTVILKDVRGTEAGRYSYRKGKG